MRAMTLAVLFVIASLSARAGEFSDAAQGIEDQLQDLRNRVETLEGGIVMPPDSVCDPEARVVALEPGQEPILQHHIPGHIEAEDYDFGANGVAYFDLTEGNTGGMYRSDDVDVKSTQDSTGSFQVGWNAEGEWLEYTVGVCSGVYDIWLRVTAKAAEPGSIQVSLGGKILGSIDVQNTGSWNDNFVTQKIEGVVVEDNGNRILRLDFTKSLSDINWIRFVPEGSVNHAPTDILSCPPDYTNTEECV